jgi:hypothetical protein
MKALIMHFVLGLAFVFCCAGICQAHNEKTAYAIPLEDIIIDGKLDDWPEEMAVYPIEWVLRTRPFNPTPPDGPEDLTASFRAGYDQKANLLYLGVVVQDEDLVVLPEAPRSGGNLQDVCEVYVDADHSGGDGASQEAKGAQLYIVVPGSGRYNNGPAIDGNPTLAFGDTQRSGVQVAFLRSGQTLVYEWAIPLFASFPEEPFQVEVGKTIGFDVVVDDADGQDHANWVAWTPGDGKVNSSNFFGNLVLLESYAELGTIAGVAVEKKEKTPYAGLILEAYQQDDPVGSVQTDAAGQYHLSLRPGEYNLKVQRGQGVEPAERLF